MLGFDMAMEEGGEWLLRIEDIDRQRSKPEWEAAIYEDLEWLGLRWPEPVTRQSERMEAYQQVLDDLWEWGKAFECTCSRADVLAASVAPQEGSPIVGPDGIRYPGTCRGNRSSSGNLPRRFPDSALRLDMAYAAHLGAQPRVGAGEFFTFQESGAGPSGEHGLVEFTADEIIRIVGDVVLARRGMGTSYHLSVVVDDAAQGITHVVRGQDLFEATKIHVVLQRLLGLPTPTYHHHRLIRDEAGRRLAKREDAKAIRRFREEGVTPEDIRRMVGLDP
jgi:glutamyl-Q tRNA(Asp) synthetase